MSVDLAGFLPSGELHPRAARDSISDAARRLGHGGTRQAADPHVDQFVPAHASAFDELVDRLRGSLGWRYVEQEVDIEPAR